MDVIIAKSLNIRYGTPYIKPDNVVTSYDPGEAVPVSGAVAGQEIDGNNKWYKVDGMDYYIWSGGCFNTVTTPGPSATDMIPWGEMVQTAYLLYENDKTSTTPPIIDKCKFPTGWDFQSWLTVETNPNTPRYIPAKECFGFIAKDSNGKMVFVFRGTDSFRDAWDDLQAKPENDSAIGGKVESGFDETLKAMKAIDKDGVTTKALPDKVNGLDKKTECIITGHSLGASIATLAAAMLASMGFTNIKVYLFATPKTGDPVFAKAFNKLIPFCQVVQNIPDVVPQLPPTIPPFINYGDVGQIMKIDSRNYNSVKENVCCYHSLCTYLYVLGSIKFGLADTCVQ